MNVRRKEDRSRVCNWRGSTNTGIVSRLGRRRSFGYREPEEDLDIGRLSGRVKARGVCLVQQEQDDAKVVHMQVHTRTQEEPVHVMLLVDTRAR